MFFLCICTAFIASIIFIMISTTLRDRREKREYDQRLQFNTSDRVLVQEVLKSLLSNKMKFNYRSIYDEKVTWCNYTGLSTKHGICLLENESMFYLNNHAFILDSFYGKELIVYPLTKYRNGFLLGESKTYKLTHNENSDLLAAQKTAYANYKGIIRELRDQEDKAFQEEKSKEVALVLNSIK